MSTGSEGPEPTEDELRAAYEAQIKRIRVEHVLLENVITLANLGMRRTGIAPGSEDERDPGQVRLAIESIRALLPIVEQTAPEQAGALRDALSQLQLAYVRIGGAPAGAEAGTGEPEAPAPPTPPEGQAAPATEPSKPSEPVKPGEPGPAQRSGRLWVPGQS